MERHFDEQLALLKQNLVKMSALSETLFLGAVEMLCGRDPGTAPRLREQEEQTDRLQMEIDSLCLRLIALYQPAAGDLRFILGAVKTNADLERMADLALTICEQAGSHPGGAAAGTPVEELLADMADLTSLMVNESLHAYVNRAPDPARAVLLRDCQIGRLKRRITEQIGGLMQRDPAAVPRLLDLLLAVQNLDRIGGHAANIAENTIFVVQGLDVRHPRG